MLTIKEAAARYEAIVRAASDPNDVPARAFVLLAQRTPSKPDPISTAFDAIEDGLEAVGDFLFGR